MKVAKKENCKEINFTVFPKNLDIRNIQKKAYEQKVKNNFLIRLFFLR